MKIINQKKCLRIYLFQSGLPIVEIDVADVALGLCFEGCRVSISHNHPLIVIEDVEAAFLNFLEPSEEILGAFLPKEFFVWEVNPRYS